MNTTAPKKIATRLRTLDGWQGDAALSCGRELLRVPRNRGRSALLRW